LRAPVRSDPRSWNGRPDGTGEAATPQQPCRGCYAARGSTLTSWRSGRRGQHPCEEGAGSLGVVCRRRSERRMLGWAYGSRPGLLRLVQQQQVSQRSAWPSHASTGRRGPWGRSGWCDSTESEGLDNESRRASVTTRKRHRTFRGPLVESLILAQDQRWRRA
jgi:hypothetical protein